MGSIAQIMTEPSYHTRLPSISVVTQKRRASSAPVGVPRDNVVLLRAIDEMDPATLREALKKICTTVPRAMQLGIRDLLVHRDACDLEYGELVNDDEAARDAMTRRAMANRGEPLSKVKCAKFAACKNCKNTFDRSHNSIGDCVWHSGELELDYSNDVWADEFEDCDRCLKEAHMNDCPEGFRWTCCEEQADAKGCMRTKHESANLLPREELTTPFAYPNYAKQQLERSWRPSYNPKRQRVW